MEALFLIGAIIFLIVVVNATTGSDRNQVIDRRDRGLKKAPPPRTRRNPKPINRHKTLRPAYPSKTPPKPTIRRHGEPLVGKCYVIDGDTIVIEKVHIRLFGIDAPELDHPYGQKAKWAMVRLCKGQVIRAFPSGNQTMDNYERFVATCLLPDGRDLSAELVKMGLAIDWPKFSEGVYRQYEVPGVRKKLWRAVARQQGRMIY